MDEAFVAYLDDLGARREKGESSARAAMAVLRRGLGKTPADNIGAYKYLMEQLHGIAPQHDRYFLVASLYASHPAHDGTAEGIGASMRRAADLFHRSGVDGSSTERRFVQLLDAHQEELPMRLRQAIALLRSRERVPVNYLRLLRDLGDWDREDKRVQQRWAQQFWTPQQSEEAKKPDTEAAAAASEGE